MTFAKQSYSREINYEPLQLTHSDLERLIIGLQRSVALHNNSINPPWESISVGDKERSISLSGPLEPHQLSELPSSVYTTTYYYSADGSAPISKIELLLTDPVRKLRISGSKEEAVDNVHAQLDLSLRKHRIFLAGPYFRMVCWLICAFVASLIAFRIRFSLSEGLVYLSLHNFRGTQWIGLGVLFALNVCPILFSTEHLFPGYLLVNQEVPIFQRYDAEISMFTMFSGVAMWLKDVFKKNKNGE